MQAALSLAMLPHLTVAHPGSAQAGAWGAANQGSSDGGLGLLAATAPSLPAWLGYSPMPHAPQKCGGGHIAPNSSLTHYK